MLHLQSFCMDTTVLPRRAHFIKLFRQLRSFQLLITLQITLCVLHDVEVVDRCVMIGPPQRLLRDRCGRHEFKGPSNTLLLVSNKWTKK